MGHNPNALDALIEVNGRKGLLGAQYCDRVCSVTTCELSDVSVCVDRLAISTLSLLPETMLRPSTTN